MSKRLRVNMIKCDGFGHCAELLPERVELDSWGYPMISGKALSPDLLKLAKKALFVCPVGALRLEDVEESR
jgi:ferredoxin